MSPEQCKHLIGVLQKAVNALENKNMQDVQEQPAAIAERIAQPPAVEELVVPPHIKSLIDADFNTSSNNPLKYLKGTFTSPRRRFLPPTVNIATNDASANDAFEIIGGHVRVSVGESLLDRFTSQRSAGTLENDMDLLNEKYPNATTFSFDCKMSVLLNNSDATGIRVDTRGYPFKACVSLENSTDRYDSIAAFINAS